MKGEKLYKRREVYLRLNVTKYGYQKLIDSGILKAPIRLSENSHPFHTESQLKEAERKLYERSNPIPRARAIKPISEQDAQYIREYYLKKEEEKRHKL